MSWDWILAKAERACSGTSVALFLINTDLDLSGLPGMGGDGFHHWFAPPSDSTRTLLQV